MTIFSAFFSGTSILYKLYSQRKKGFPKKHTKNYHFWNAYEMGRPSIRVKLTITSKDDDRFSNPRTFLLIN